MQIVEIIMISLGVLAVLALLTGIVMHNQQKKPVIVGTIPQEYKDILARDVVFYQNQSEEKKQEFEKRMMHFLATTRITGVKAEVSDIDKVYIAASAIIPIFGFGGWQYNNLNEVLLYPDSFSHEFEQEGEGRNILGMVGEGPYNNVMILSQHEVQQAFINKTSKNNTAIHEFVHLIDKSDGSVDGFPEYFADKRYAKPWLQLMHREIEKMMRSKSDIDTYAATNQAEFLAVVSEYFFERPDLLEEKHPELYALLSKFFQQDPVEVQNKN